ncbi:unnamed protein product [Haemonchus placei]|uniref:Uncharacterized protein n=1 Tax=Haemonchus placei TaxID=6290 RepID=A0A0N4WDI2_HAEPC|nr:unnamed protein product [Haemonchus placei]
MPPISTGSNGMVPSLAIPPPDLISMPHPVGTQRIAPYAVQYTGFSASALAHPLRSCHNTSQPPPNGRFAQPPPPLQQEARWEKEMCSGMRQHAAMFPGFFYLLWINSKTWTY